jgi:prophage DNA circulation protein
VSWIIHSLPALLFLDTASKATITTTAAVNKATDATNATTAAVDKAANTVNPAMDAISTASVLAKHTWRAIKVFQEEDDNIIRHLCNQERSADPPTKPTKVVMYNLLQKFLVMSSRVNFKRMEDREPVYKRGGPSRRGGGIELSDVLLSGVFSVL